MQPSSWPGHIDQYDIRLFVDISGQEALYDLKQVAKFDLLEFRTLRGLILVARFACNIFYGILANTYTQTYTLTPPSFNVDIWTF